MLAPMGAMSTVWDGQYARVAASEAIARTPAAHTVEQPVSDITSKLVGAARLAPSGIASMPFRATKVLELGCRSC